MQYIRRFQEQNIGQALARQKSVLLLGPRQTGKTTIIQRLKHDLYVSFVRPDVRLRYEKNPASLTAEVEALSTRTRPPIVLLDEVQKVPDILDVVQDLIDRNVARFLLTGSSARKLRRGANINLLPGRIIPLRLDPLVQAEAPAQRLEDRLLYGSLPGILGVDNPEYRETDLGAYVTTYLEEEVRAEALVRSLGPFARFLEYAASEAGQVVNLRKLSHEIGVSHTTIAAYYQILEDCLIVERIEPLTHSKTRKKLTQSHKYLMFDLGVRRIAAREGTTPSREALGQLFEQFIGLELLRNLRLGSRNKKLLFWRDPDGPEVDWVVAEEGHYIPVEVKWTENPKPSDLRHLKTFSLEYASPCGYLVCRIPRKMKLASSLIALPWQEITTIVA